MNEVATTVVTRVALTIAGSDPSGGAGLQADLATFHQHGVYGMSVVTLVTAQNTVGVTGLECISPALVAAQLEAVLTDIPPHAIKTGALGNAALVELVAARATTWTVPLVVDPVLISKHGHRLCDDHAAAAIRTTLIPRATIVTPNLAEAEELSGVTITDIRSMELAARTIAGDRPQSILIKAGHRQDDPADYFWHEGVGELLPVTRIDSVHTHGTGCTLSAALCARLARGESMRDAVLGARAFVAEAIRTAPRLGNGRGPINHFVRVHGG